MWAPTCDSHKLGDITNLVTSHFEVSSPRGEIHQLLILALRPLSAYELATGLDQHS